MMDAPLRIHTFGGLRIEVDGKPVTGLASRKAEALFAFLAVTAQPQSRERLATMLWDDRPAARALGNLAVLLTSLRKQLLPYLKITHNTVSINLESDYWLDVAELDGQLRTAATRRRETQAYTQAEIMATQKAIALYRGDFLDGFYIRNSRDFEAWVLLERERWRRQVIEALATLIDFDLRGGAYQEGIRHARKLLALDPLREETYRYMMHLLVRDGRRNEALTQYMACVDILAEELGVKPSRETTELYERIRLGAAKPRHNLPIQTSTFVGRGLELAQIRANLADPACRLLTVVGAGGIGKSRLAIQAAAALPGVYLDGVWLVELAPLEDARLVAQTVATSLGLGGEAIASGTTGSTAGDATLEKLVQYLQSKELLLILDNCEHLLDACARICEHFLRTCPDIKILATSRERLGLTSEVLWQAPPMRLPGEEERSAGDWEAITKSDAVQLFIARAVAVQAGFQLDPTNAPIVTRICQRLDGIPLAIELTAARLRVLSLQELADRLGDRFQLLTGGSRAALPRHRTLLATMQWSYDLLTPKEQILFGRASVFGGGFTLEAVETVCSGNGLASHELLNILTGLVDKSLILTRRGADGTTRYDMLETVRAFGRRILSADSESDRWRYRHALYFMDLAEMVEPMLYRHKQKAWLQRLVTEYDNIRAALRWSIENRETDICLRIAAALWHLFWIDQGYFQEGWEWVSKTLEVSEHVTSPVKTKVILGRGALAWTLGQYELARSLIDESLIQARTLGARNVEAWALYWSGVVLRYVDDYPGAISRSESSLKLFQELEDSWGASWQLFQLGRVDVILGDYRRAITYLEECLTLKREVGDLWGAGWTLCFLSISHAALGDLEQATRLGEEALSLFREIDSKRGLAGSAETLGRVMTQKGNYREAETLLQEGLSLVRELGDKSEIASILASYGRMARLKGDLEHAMTCFQDCLKLSLDLGFKRMIANTLVEIALLAHVQQENELATRLLGATQAGREVISISISPFQREEYDHLLAELQADLGTQDFERFWQAGREMSTEEAIHIALEMHAGAR